MYKQKQLALNIACHDIHVLDMLNIDNDAAMKPDLLLDCTKLLEHFEKNTIKFIYAGHFLEHLSLEAGKKFVHDCFELLDQYGVLECVVPDWTKTFGLNTEEAERIIMANDTHKSLMDIIRLKEYFRQAGFLTIVEAEPSELGHCPFPQVKWQTCVLGVKHSKISFHGIGA